MNNPEKEILKGLEKLLSAGVQIRVIEKGRPIIVREGDRLILTNLYFNFENATDYTGGAVMLGNIGHLQFEGGAITP